MTMTMPTTSTTFNPTPKGLSFLECMLHSLEDAGRYLPRAITGLFVEPELSKSLNFAMDPQAMDKAIANRSIKQALSKLFVGKQEVLDFCKYAQWHQARFGEQSSWNKYNTANVIGENTRL